jgi:hypothetical protein
MTRTQRISFDPPESPAMTRADVLRDETFKGDVDEIDRRVYYTLTKNKDLEAHRTAKAVASLVELLHRKGTLTEDEVDEFLFGCVR